jgi:hypothetical protein
MRGREGYARRWPVAFENDYAVWRAPSATTTGRNYEESERIIQRLLMVEDDLVSPVLGVSRYARRGEPAGAETYIGSEQAQTSPASPGRI